jgi:hypothetical protein
VVWNVYKATVTRHTKASAGLAYLAVALCATSADGERYIEFQGPDDQEPDWGYCIVDGPPHHFQGGGIEGIVDMLTSHATLYGGLLSATFDGPNLVLTFTNEAQRIFKWPQELTLRLDITSEERDALRQALPEALAIGPRGTVPTVTL